MVMVKKTIFCQMKVSKHLWYDKWNTYLEINTPQCH